jgi:hypothetical protein
LLVVRRKTTPEPRRSKAERGAEYERGVFINCPFDTAYRPLFDAIVFVVFVCGLVPRSALEIDDAAQTRIDKIASLIGGCRWGVHDISRVELNAHGLPRFNMPLELGLFLGARWFGSLEQRRKSCLVLDTDPFRYQRFISDISGQDITPHGGDTGRIIAAVRNWLSNSLPSRVSTIPGGIEIARRFARFQAELPALCWTLRIEIHELTFADYTRVVSSWLRDTQWGPA